MGAETFFETMLVEGLDKIAGQELLHRFSDQVRLFYPPGHFAGTLQFAYGGSPHNLLSLKTVLGAFWVTRFPVPRPKALLGHQNLTFLLERIAEIRRLWPRNAFKTVHLAAAGAETEVMARIAQEIAGANELEITREEGDLLVRLRRPLDGSQGWEAAVRMSPRPLSVRPWRVCDWKGALNAAVAQAVIQLTLPRSTDVFLNITCGSATLLIERAANSPVRLALGCDTDREALACAQSNVQAAKQAGRIQLAPWDARALPLAGGSVDVICADLPFGHDVGSHVENQQFYPLLLQEAARVARPDARCALLTHEIRLMDSLLENSTDWQVREILPISLAGLHPRIYILSPK